MAQARCAQRPSVVLFMAPPVTVKYLSRIPYHRITIVLNLEFGYTVVENTTIHKGLACMNLDFDAANDGKHLHMFKLHVNLRKELNYNVAKQFPTLQTLNRTKTT